MIAECCCCGCEIEIPDEELLEIEELDDYFCDDCASAAFIFITDTFKCREN